MGMMIRRNRMAKKAETKAKSAARPEEFGLPFVDVPEAATAKDDKPKTVKRKAGKPKFD